MKGLLLIGGQATRLLPLSKYLAKSLLPICDRELLHYQISALAMAGIGEIVLAVGHLSDQIREFAGNYKGLRLHISEEQEPLGTAGAIARAAEFIGGEQVVVLNADILCDAPIAKIIECHRTGGRSATIMGYAVPDPSRYGLLRVRGEEIAGFSEKPAGDPGLPPHYINAGVYVLEPEVVASIPTGRAVSIEREVFPGLISERGALTFYAHEGLWIDVGTFESYFAANFQLLGRRYALGEFALWGERDDSVVFKDLVYINKSARLSAEGQGHGVDLYHRVIMMAGCEVRAGTRLENTILMPGARVGPNCSLNTCIIGPGADVEEGREVSHQIIIENEDPVAFYPHAT